MNYPDDNPKTQFGLAKVPVHLVPPALIRGAAEAWANGAEKYGPFNWREHTISSTVYYAACMRHLTDWYDRIDADDCAPDSKVHHLKHAAACIGMLLDTLGSNKLNDNRPLRCPSANTAPEALGAAISSDPLPADPLKAAIRTYYDPGSSNEVIARAWNETPKTTYAENNQASVNPDGSGPKLILKLESGDPDTVGESLETLQEKWKP